MESGDQTQIWVEEARGGDPKAFDRLMEAHRGRLEAVVRRRLGGYLRQKIEVEDVLQETFLKAFQSIGSYREQGPDSFRRWLRGIAENVLLYWARQHQRTNFLPLDRDLEGKDIAPSKSLRREERFERLQAAFSRLSDEHREVILLARVEGLPMKEIAKRLERSPAAVRQLLWRAVQKLGSHFGETESFNLPRRSLAGEGEKDET